MESSNIFGGNEDCQSSESGWTMYIGSPTHDDEDDDNNSDDGDDDGDDDDDGYDAKCDGGDDSDDGDGDDDDDDDDSMASDASSGPSRRGRNNEEGQGMNEHKHDEDEDEDEESKRCDHKEGKGQVMEIKREGRRAEGRQESMFVMKRGNKSPQSGKKERKNSCMGKRN